ncbi:Putative ATP-dependent RNA helicase DHX33 [Toxocara canis]|uniref:RNA helicase n=1 Tax=Toxocara canis TaxID=6265 RepID=A0A0B2V022_TOXCA|nr:Putative ATP-dependent RNA helicase DHX33 [Toxocara canis]
MWEERRGDQSEGHATKKRLGNEHSNGNKAGNGLIKKRRFARADLPINAVRSELANAIKANRVCIVAAKTASGKSTQVPQICYEEGLHGDGMIAITQPRRVAAVTLARRVATEMNTELGELICYEEGLHGDGMIAITQPRRVAAVTLARRVATEMNTELGELVGYKVRFENVVSDKTKIVYGTDGIFLREAFYDSMLSRYSLVIVDEAHERSLHTDVLLYVLRLCYEQRKSSTPLTIVIMSATLETDLFSEYFSNAPVFMVKGQRHPIEIVIMSATLETDLFSEYFSNAPVFMVKGQRHPIELFYANSLNSVSDDYMFNALVALMQIHRTEPIDWDVLVFLTGQEEIEFACKKAREAAQLTDHALVALPLYAGLTDAAQMKVFEPVETPVSVNLLFG